MSGATASGGRLNAGYAYRSRIAPADHGRALLDYLADRYPHSTAADWLARLEGGEVAVGTETVTADAVLRTGDAVVWQRPPWREAAVPERFDVLHDDGDVLAVAKPSGLPTLPAGGFLEHTLLHLVRRRWPAAHAVHRLGRATSGVVLFALSPLAATALTRAMRERQLAKTYLALVSGAPAWRRLDVTTPIGRIPHPRLGTVHAASDAGREAHSRFAVVEPRGDTTLVEVSIATGRPHQIRIHAAVAGHPLAGDPVYAAGGGLREAPGLPGDNGYLLHAWRVSFVHPRTARACAVIAPPPAALAARDGSDDASGGRGRDPLAL
ncbi:MAG: RluA family pseudouridine synthase [Vicinamibacterales bacterium]